MTYSNRHTHTAPLSKSLKILNIDNINYLTTSQFVYKALNNITATEIKFEFASNIHNMNIRDQLRLRTPRFKYEPRRHSLAYHGCIVWNELNNDIKTSLNLFVFKKKLKTLLLDK